MKMRILVSICLFAVSALQSGCLFLGLEQTEIIKSSKLALRINCGSDVACKDTQGNTWLPDQMTEKHAMWGAVGGETLDRGPEVVIPGPIGAPMVYRTERFGLSAYEFSLPDGTYTVRLHFAETYEAVVAPGERVFSVSIGGKTVLEDFDPLKEAGGPNKGIMREFRGVAVGREKLVIGFEAKTQNTEINGIEIVAE